MLCLPSSKMDPRRTAVLSILICLSLAGLSVGQKSPESRQLSPQSKETTTADFFRLVVMRLIFGIASAMGYGEGLSNVLGGIFVPPGSDYDDDYDIIPDLF